MTKREIFQISRRFVSALAIAAVLAASFSFLLMTNNASAVTRTWDGGGGDANWSTDANWSDNTEPGTSDIATFDGTCAANCSPTIDATISVGGINMATGYAGTITMAAGVDVTVGDSDFILVAGTFTGGTGTLTLGTSGINAVDFTMTGGTFTSPTTVSFTTQGHTTIDVSSSVTFTNMIINKSNEAYIIAVASGDTVTVTSDLTLTNGILNGPGVVSVQGNITQASTADLGTGTVDFGAAGAQTYTINGGSGPKLRLDSAADASDTLVMSAAGTLYGLELTSGFSGTMGISNSGNFTLTIDYGGYSQAAGTFPGGTFTLTLGTGTINNHNFTITGGTFTSPTTVSFVTQANVTIDVNSSVTFTNMTVNKSSLGYFVTIASGDTVTVTSDLTLTDGGLNGPGTVTVNGNITQASTADLGT
ncbi:MAG: hypothetical protein Q8R08_01365, partial [bacterium]|nr:hypothetical protein [bacterium]